MSEWANMKELKKTSIYALCAITALCAGSALASEQMLPEGLVMADTFKPGIGLPVGKIQVVLGKVVLMHADMLRGYWAKKGLPLFNGDTIVGLDNGFITFRLNDGSLLSLRSKTRLLINRSFFDQAKRTRTSFLRMSVGKAMFRVKKMVNFKRSKFKVQTSTAIIGIRGSRFIVMATPKITEVTALEKTELEVVNSTFPESRPILLTDFERAVVIAGAIASEVEAVTFQEIEEMQKEFAPAPGGADNVQGREGATTGSHEGIAEEGADGESPVADGNKVEGAGEGIQIGQGVGEDGKVETEEGQGADRLKGEAGEAEYGGGQGVLIPDDEIVEPANPEESEEWEEPPSPETFSGPDIEPEPPPPPPVENDPLDDAIRNADLPAFPRSP